MLSPRLHPDIEEAYGHGRPILSKADMDRLWALTRKWIVLRANQLCPDGRPKKWALVQAIRESGAHFTDQEINTMWEANQRELDDPVKCPIVVTSEREYQDEIEKAKQRGDLFQRVRW